MIPTRRAALAQNGFRKKLCLKDKAVFPGVVDRYLDHDEWWRDVLDYIEPFSNPKRQALDNRTVRAAGGIG
jgi:hypothetical protein